MVIALKSAVGFVKYVDVLEAQHLTIDPQIIVLISAFGIAGSLLGNLVARRMTTERLKQGFGVFLIVMGVYVLGTSVPQLIGGGA